MSKDTSSNKFRTVDVDLYDLDQFDDNEDTPVEGEEQGPNESEINGYLSQSKNLDALRVVLNNPPLAAKNQAVKDKAVLLAVRVMTAFKPSEIDGAVKSLDTKLLDVLMKYIYRGFEFPSEGSSASLLTWHEKTFNSGGLGSIVRVLTDRKHV